MTTPLLRAPSPDMTTIRDDFRTTSRLVQLEYGAYTVFLIYGVYTVGRIISATSYRFRDECAAQTLPAVVPHLGPGVDDHDIQWRLFCDAFPLLMAGLVAWVLASRLVRAYTNPKVHAAVLCAMGLGFVFVAHGRGAIPVVLLQLLNYGYSKLYGRLPYSVYLGLMWAVHVALLVYNERSDGWAWAFDGDAAPLAVFRGLGHGLVRWQVSWNMNALRLLGYNFDRWEASNTTDEQRRKVTARHEGRCVDCVETGADCYKLRTDLPRPEAEFTFVHYLAYVNYTPLYTAGPLSSYGAFMSHLFEQQRAFSVRQLAVYAVRTAWIYGVLQLLLHVAHVNCFREVPGLFSQMTPAEQCAAGYLTLAFLWLKFNVLWKFFRAVALADGFEAPEDMPQCYSNTTTVGDFWRGWHASFNLWIVRYMYIPLGGRKTRLLSVVPIFLFIALWHDTTLHLLFWALLMIGAFIPEVVVQVVVAAKFAAWKKRPYWRHLAALGGTGSTLMLIIANLYGYGTKMSSTEGVRSVFDVHHAAMVAAFTCFFIYCMNQTGNAQRRLKARTLERRKRACGIVEPHTE